MAADARLEAWPFLVARGRYARFQVVVTPDFLKTAAQRYPLMLLASGDTTAPGSVLLREVDADGQATLTAAYRFYQPRADEYGIDDEDGLLYDQGGRPVFVAAGLILRQPSRSVTQLALTMADLARAHEQLREPFAKLWPSQDSMPPRPSTPLTVGGAPYQALRNVAAPPVGAARGSGADPFGDEDRPSRLRRTALAVGGIVLLVGGAVVAVAATSHPTVKQVTPGKTTQGSAAANWCAGLRKAEQATNFLTASELVGFAVPQPPVEGVAFAALKQAVDGCAGGGS